MRALLAAALVMALAGCGRKHEAAPSGGEQDIAALMRARDANPQSPAVWEQLARAYARHGRWDDAIAAARQQVKLLPGDPAAQKTLDEIRSQSGR